MKLGLGLYRHMLDRENFQFARQAGATHVVVHLVDYFAGAKDQSAADQPTGNTQGWGRAGDPTALWTLEELVSLRKQVEEHGLKLEAIENFDPAHWYDVLLDGPRRDEQLENLKEIVRRVGEAEIPIIGYNFSIAGVCGRTSRTFARGGAESVGMQGTLDTPIPQGMVWNMVYDEDVPPGNIPSATHEQLWQRLEVFLNELLPVAEQAGVKLAAHPDDPPLPELRQQPRLVYQPDMYQRLLDIDPSSANCLEFCVGTLAEMTEGDVYDATEVYSKQEKIGYVHFRNVSGKVPHYHETFVDDGDIDMLRVLRILHRNGYEGVVIPDHTPSMTCPGPWHAGMAYALGYLQAALKSLEAHNDSRHEELTACTE